MNPHYSIDTNALVTWFNRTYPPDVFPKLVPLMEGLIRQGRLRASEYVREELHIRTDALYAWAVAQADLFVPTDADVVRRAADLIARYPRLVDPNAAGAVDADPYVIALAAASAGCGVVTQETEAKTKSGRKKKKTYIPDVCLVEKIRCVDSLEMMRLEKWAL